MALTGPGGLLKQLTKMVVEAALDEEMSEHLGYDKGGSGSHMPASTSSPWA
jgi:transposase-like protein